MTKTRSRILLAWHVCWFAILLVAYHLQNESCRLVPEQLNRCLTFGGRYIFMTHILQLSSKITYALFIGSSLVPRIIPHCVPSILWSRLIVPLSTVVCFLYQILYAIDPNLVRNPLTVQYIPANLDFLIHVAIVPAALIESFLGQHQIKIGKSMQTMTLFMISYSAWSILTFYMTQKWPYGIISKIGVLPSLSVFIPLCLLIALFGTFVCSRVERMSLKLLDQNQNLRLTVSASGTLGLKCKFYLF